MTKNDSALETDFSFYLPTNSSVIFWPSWQYPNMSFIGLGEVIFKTSVNLEPENKMPIGW